MAASDGEMDPRRVIAESDVEVFGRRLEAVLAKQYDLLMSKRKSYGATNLTKRGSVGILTRIEDKIGRIDQMALAETTSSADGDSLLDAWRDIMGYAILGLMHAVDQQVAASVEPLTAKAIQRNRDRAIEIEFEATIDELELTPEGFSAIANLATGKPRSVIRGFQTVRGVAAKFNHPDANNVIIAEGAADALTLTGEWSTPTFDIARDGSGIVTDGSGLLQASVEADTPYAVTVIINDDPDSPGRCVIRVELRNEVSELIDHFDVQVFDKVDNRTHTRSGAPRVAKGASLSDATKSVAADFVGGINRGFVLPDVEATAREAMTTMMEKAVTAQEAVNARIADIGRWRAAGWTVHQMSSEDGYGFDARSNDHIVIIPAQYTIDEAHKELNRAIAAHDALDAYQADQVPYTIAEPNRDYEVSRDTWTDAGWSFNTNRNPKGVQIKLFGQSGYPHTEIVSARLPTVEDATANVNKLLAIFTKTNHQESTPVDGPVDKLALDIDPESDTDRDIELADLKGRHESRVRTLAWMRDQGWQPGNDVTFMVGDEKIRRDLTWRGDTLRDGSLLEPEAAIENLYTIESRGGLNQNQLAAIGKRDLEHDGWTVDVTALNDPDSGGYKWAVYRGPIHLETRFHDHVMNPLLDLNIATKRMTGVGSQAEVDAMLAVAPSLAEAVKGQYVTDEPPAQNLYPNLSDALNDVKSVY